jgi:hypothetical protein
MISLRLTNKLRISGPLPNQNEIAETRRALERAKQQLPPTDKVKLTTLIWVLFVEAMRTHRSMGDPERRYLRAGERIAWPTVVHTPQEIWEADLQRLIDLKMSRDEPPAPRLGLLDATAVDRMCTVLSWLRFVRGQHAERDRSVFLKLASGSPPRHAKQFYGYPCSDSTVKMTKDRVLRHIAVAIQSYSNC